jgi:hypothetical protein
MGCGGAAAIFGASRFGAGGRFPPGGKGGACYSGFGADGGFSLDGGASACYASVHATSGAEEGSIKLV